MTGYAATATQSDAPGAASIVFCLRPLRRRHGIMPLADLGGWPVGRQVDGMTQSRVDTRKPCVKDHRRLELRTSYALHYSAPVHCAMKQQYYVEQ